MNLSALNMPTQPDGLTSLAMTTKRLEKTGSPELREAFNDFVGQTFYGQLLGTMRESIGKPAYFHGGRGEEVFQKQLDQILAEKLSDSSAAKFSEPMFELMMLPKPN